MAQLLRTERTEARLGPEQKRRIEQAASLKGLSVSDFIVQHADEAAIRTIQLHASWTLDERDRDFFWRLFYILQNPEAAFKPLPNDTSSAQSLSD
jgi:uncharacterized protein (DUF1778 family)